MQLIGLSNTISLSLSKTQARFLSDVSRLSSGLRIQTAADDPSGLAIAEELRAQVAGYDQAKNNAQSAINAVTVADGALQSVTVLLDRLLVLTVKAGNDLLSADDRNNIQTESQQLQNEINTIAANANFNGIQLLNRQPFDGDIGPQVVTPTFATSSNVSGFTNTPVGSAWTFATANGFGTQGIYQTTAAQALDNLQTPPSGSSQIAMIQGNNTGFIQTVTNFHAGSTYALTFNVAQGTGAAPREDLQVQVHGSTVGSYNPVSANSVNPEWQQITTSTFSPGTGTYGVTFRSYNAGSRNLYIDNVQIVLVSGPNLALPRLGSSVLAINDGAAEGSVLNVTLPTVFTANLGISTDSLATSTTAATYETHLQTALDVVSGARAALGAQMVTLQIDAANDSVADVNLTASESNIRDANVAETTTAFTADQILSSIATSILANAASQASLVEKLFA